MAKKVEQGWTIRIGDRDTRAPAARIAAGAQEYPVAESRAAKPPVVSVDLEADPVPARAAAKAAGTFGVELPYERRERA